MSLTTQNQNRIRVSFQLAMFTQGLLISIAGIACIYMAHANLELHAVSSATAVGAWGIWFFGFSTHANHSPELSRTVNQR